MIFTYQTRRIVLKSNKKSYTIKNVGFYLRVKSTNSKIKTFFNTPIELDMNKEYEMALVG